MIVLSCSITKEMAMELKCGNRSILAGVAQGAMFSFSNQGLTSIAVENEAVFSCKQAVSHGLTQERAPGVAKPKAPTF